MNVGSCERRMKTDTKEILRVVILPHIDIISVMCKETANVSPNTKSCLRTVQLLTKVMMCEQEMKCNVQKYQ